ncbi:MAG: DUF4403 family protein [Candidatus Competibacterales bacterium]
MKRLLRTLLSVFVVAAAALVGALYWGAQDKSLGQRPTPGRPEVDLDPYRSVIPLPITVGLQTLQDRVEARLPQILKTFDRQRELCPLNRCQTFALRGQVARSTVNMVGRGEFLALEIPVAAEVTAGPKGSVGRLLSQGLDLRVEAQALLNVDMRLALTPQWTPVPTVEASYRWLQPPHLQVLDRSLAIRAPVDDAMGEMMTDLERDIAASLGQRLAFDAQLAASWEQLHRPIQLAAAPPVWLVPEPEALAFGGFRFDPRAVTTTLAITTRSRVFLDDEPPPAEVTPLPPWQPLAATAEPRLVLQIPLGLTFAELAAAIEAELTREPIELGVAGQLKLANLTLYASDQGELVVGVDAGYDGPGGVVDTEGQLYLAGYPTLDTATETVVLERARFSRQVDNWLVAGASALLAAPLRASIEEATRFDYGAALAPTIDEINVRLAAGIRRGPLALQGRVEGVSPIAVHVGAEELVLVVETQGQVTAELIPEDPPPG